VSSINILPFRGLASRQQKLLKANTFAECAINTNLQDGSLSAYPCPEFVCDATFDIKEFTHDCDCECTLYRSESYIETYLGRTYVANDIEAYSDNAADCSGGGLDRVALGMPTPNVPPTVNFIVESGDQYQPSAYMYTYVSKRVSGHVFESAPSPLSRQANCGVGTTISNMEVPSIIFSLTHIRVYRVDAGWKSGSESNVQNNSGCLLIGEFPFGTTTITDNFDQSDNTMFGLITYDLESMPSNPNGLGATAFSIFSWRGKELFISVDGMPEMRRKNGRFEFDDDIVTARYWNSSIYVFTKRYNYRIDEQAETGGVSYSNPPFRFEKVAPIVNEFSVSVGATGVFYQASSGINVLSGSSMGGVSTGILNSSQWKAYQRVNVRTHVYNQFLFIFSSDWNFTHVFEFEDGVFGDNEFSNHTIYPYSISSMAQGDDGELYFSSEQEVFRFVESNFCADECFDQQSTPICEEFCPYDYRIMPVHDVKITDYSTGYIRIDPFYGDVTFRLWDRACGEALVHEQTFSGCSEHEFRLPSGCLSEEHVIQLEGCARVFELRLSTSSKDMGLNR